MSNAVTLYAIELYNNIDNSLFFKGHSLTKPHQIWCSKNVSSNAKLRGNNTHDWLGVEISSFISIENDKNIDFHKRPAPKSHHQPDQLAKYRQVELYFVYK